MTATDNLLRTIREYRERERAIREELGTALQRADLTIKDALAANRAFHERDQAVRALHPRQQLPTAPDGYAICPTCDKGPAPGRHVPWPCPTIRALDGAS